jgi:hypothetical protein
MPVTIMLDSRNPRDTGMQDMCRHISATLGGREWVLWALAADFWLLIQFLDSGIVDHPIGEGGGNSLGKAVLPWYQRDHEILGYGRTPHEAATGILRRGQSARLKGIRRANAETGKMSLLFRDLDSNRVFFPDQLFMHHS